MSPKRSAAIVVGVALLVAWLAAAGGVGRADPPAGSAPAAGRVDTPPADEPQGPVDRLAEGFRVQPEPPQPARNPFSFESSRPSAPESLPVQSAAEFESASAQDAGRRPDARVVLVGVAERHHVDGTVRTAILTVAADLLLAQTGDRVASRYRVAAIDAEAVRLVDDVSGEELSLMLP